MWLPARQTIAPKTPGPSTEVLEFGNNSFSPRFEACVGGSSCRIGDGGPSLESIGVTHPEVSGAYLPVGTDQFLLSCFYPEMSLVGGVSATPSRCSEPLLTVLGGIMVLGIEPSCLPHVEYVPQLFDLSPCLKVFLLKVPHRAQLCDLLPLDLSTEAGK